MIQSQIVIYGAKQFATLPFEIYDIAKISELKEELGQKLNINSSGICLLIFNVACADDNTAGHYKNKYPESEIKCVLTQCTPRLVVRNFRIIKKLKGDNSSVDKCV